MRPPVKTGLERLITEEATRLKGRRVGLCCNPTSVDRWLRHAVDLLQDTPECELVALFGPEHGIRSEAQYMEGVDDVGEDTQTGLPVYSLYGSEESSLKPTPASLEGIDLMLFDIQDVGSRYYTYIYTMSYIMEAAAEAGIEVWVLDRPNPIGGIAVEGPTIAPGFESFVGRYPMPNRHGMTAGEIALYFNESANINCKLQVIPASMWRRRQWSDETSLPWIMPSPNMPTIDTATVYPGGCLLEGTNISEGRGTTRPFELLGAPYLDPFELTDTLAAFELPGVSFRPVSFTPTFDKWTGVSCNGVQIHVTDRLSYKPFLTGVAIIQACVRLAPDDFAWRKEAYEFVDDIPAIDLLFGNDKIRPAIEQHADPFELEQEWRKDQEEFLKRRDPFLLYPV